MNKQPQAVHLQNRGLLSLEGADKKSFLQAIITQDIEKLDVDTPLYAAILTPQGKYLFDFFLSQSSDGESIFIDCEAERTSQLIARLTMYKLRADVTITDLSNHYDIWAILEGGSGYPDPRHHGLGNRLIIAKGEEPQCDIAPYDTYDILRLKLGIPDASKDIELEKRPVLEANFEALNGVSFNKGCYVGQEVTARMQHRGAVRKHIYAISVVGGAPAFGSIIYCDDKKAGHLLSANGELALALIKDEYTKGDHLLTSEGKTIELRSISR